MFALNTDGTNFHPIHAFDTSPGNGQGPSGNMVLNGSTLYGTTSRSTGTITGGTVYAVNTDGTNYHVLHEFSNNSDGFSPMGVALVGSTLVGVTAGGGASNGGVIWSIRLDGSGYQLLHDFGQDNGAFGLVSDGVHAYGITRNGGTFGGGTLFVITVPEPSSLALAAFGLISLAIYGWRKRSQR